MKVFFDYETRSTEELKKSGAYRYALHPTTDAICLAYAFDDDPVKIWRPLDHDKPPLDIIEAAKDPSVDFIAHNATFDWLIWNAVCRHKHGWPLLPIERVYCTMAQAYAMGLQGSLENAAKNVGLNVQKDMKGNRVMLQLAKPRSVSDDGVVTWWRREDSKPKLDINEKYEMTYKYAMQDINVLRELYKRLLPLSEMERKLWLLDNRINNRGVYVDLPNAEKAIALAKFETDFLNQKVREISNNEISSCNAHVRFREWVQNQGVETDSLDKAAMAELLEEGGLPPHVEEAIKIKQAASKSSVAKLQKIISSQFKGRCQGQFQYHGAASTGRWAARGIQLQNIPRPTIKQIMIEAVFKLFERIAI